jgi:protein tyrosine phosphatase
VKCLIFQLKEQRVDYEEYIVRHLRAARGTEVRDLVHLHYGAWPDRGTPKCIPSILNMIELMRAFQTPFLVDAPPILVHCRLTTHCFTFCCSNDVEML